MEKMLPDQLKAAWQAVEAAQFTAEEFERRREA